MGSMIKELDGNGLIMKAKAWSLLQELCNQGRNRGRNQVNGSDTCKQLSFKPVQKADNTQLDPHWHQEAFINIHLNSNVWQYHGDEGNRLAAVMQPLKRDTIKRNKECNVCKPGLDHQHNLVFALCSLQQYVEDWSRPFEHNIVLDPVVLI